MRTFYGALGLILAAGVTSGFAGNPAPQFTELGWNEAAYGPLPAHRDVRLPYDPNQSLFPEELNFFRGDEAPPSTSTVTSPPEYAPSSGVIFRYSTGAWPNVVRDCVAALTAPGHDELAYVILAATSQQAEATSRFTAAGADMSKVRWVIQPNDSIWARDYGPHFVWVNGTRCIVDSHYYPGRPNDNFCPTIIGDDYFNIPTFDIGLYYSGGNFQPGPANSGWMTALVRLDNPGYSDPFILELYNKYQGIETLNILPQFPFSVDGTGHIDMWFYLVDDNDAVISQFTMSALGLPDVPGAASSTTAPVSTARDVANNAVPYMTSRGFTVTRTPAWSAFRSEIGGNAHYTYANAYRVNNRIFVPKYGSGSPAGGTGFSSTYLPYDNYAVTAWQNAAGPGVEIVPIACYDIIWASGAIHCIMKQVPRFTGSNPAVTVLSPNGGEQLVSGTSHTIRWEATDDVAVANVDLYYRTSEGGPWQLIAASQPDTGTYNWTVPGLYSNNCRVRVVARDTSFNQGEAISEAVFRIAPGVRRLYSFASGAGVDKFGYGYQTTSWSVLNNVRRPAAVSTVLTAAQYAAIATSNATSQSESDPNRYNAPQASIGSEPTLIFEFTIQEPVSRLADIQLEWEGFITDCSQAELYVWDYISGQWGDGRGGLGDNRFVDNRATRRDATLTGNIRSNFGRYVGPGGQMTLLAYSERGSISSILYRMMTDYVAITTTVVFRPGDLNCDGLTNFDDIEGFTLALISPAAYAAAYPDCYHYLADANADGLVDFDDIDAFVTLVIGG